MTQYIPLLGRLQVRPFVERHPTTIIRATGERRAASQLYEATVSGRTSAAGSNGQLPRNEANPSFYLKPKPIFSASDSD